MDAAFRHPGTLPAAIPRPQAATLPSPRKSQRILNSSPLPLDARQSHRFVPARHAPPGAQIQASPGDDHRR
jgi:hypothetical protein